MRGVSRTPNTQFAVAVHALTLLASAPGTPMSSEEMAGSVLANPVHLRRVLGRLRGAGLVTSRPGPRGGWQLTRTPEEIPLGDVWRAIHGEDPLLTLHGVNPACPVAAGIERAFADVDRRAAGALVAELDRTTVADVLGGVAVAGAPS